MRAPIEQSTIVWYVVISGTLLSSEVLLFRASLKQSRKVNYASIIILHPTAKQSITCILQILYLTCSPLHPWDEWQRLNWNVTPPSQVREHVENSDHADQPWFLLLFCSSSSPSALLFSDWSNIELVDGLIFSL